MIKQIKERIDLLLHNDPNNHKYILIGQLLETDKRFLKMDIEIAYSILRDLQYKEEDIKNIYMELIDEEMSN